MVGGGREGGGGREEGGEGGEDEQRLLYQKQGPNRGLGNTFTFTIVSTIILKAIPIGIIVLPHHRHRHPPSSSSPIIGIPIGMVTVVVLVILSVVYQLLAQHFPIIWYLRCQQAAALLQRNCVTFTSRLTRSRRKSTSEDEAAQEDADVCTGVQEVEDTTPWQALRAALQQKNALLQEEAVEWQAAEERALQAHNSEQVAAPSFSVMR